MTEPKLIRLMLIFLFVLILLTWWVIAGLADNQELSNLEERVSALSQEIHANDK